MNVHRIAGTESSREATRQSSVPTPPFRWQTRIALPIGLLLAAAALLLVSAWGTLFPGRAVTVVPAMVRSVSGAAGTTSVTASGWLEPDPYAIYATALASGTVESVLALEGQAVTKGQPLAKLVDEDARIALRGAQADHAIAEADLERASAALAASEEGLEQLIDRRRMLASAEARLAEIEGSVARLVDSIASEEAAVGSLRDEVERKRDLVESGAVSKGEFERLRLTLDARERGLEATRKERAILESRRAAAEADRAAATQHIELRIEERRAVDVAKAEVARAEAMLAKAEADRDAAQLRLDRMTIASPIDGVVLRRLVAPGSRVTAESASEEGARVFYLYDPASMQARVDVPLADAAAIGVEQEAVLEVQTLPDREFRGRVTRLVHEADIQKNTVEVKVALDEPDERLKPEMLVRVRFLARESKSAPATREVVLVPKRLVGDGATVWVVEARSGDRGVARRRSVELGARRVEDWVEVVSGVRPGDRLVTDAPADLEDGDRVTVREEAGA